MYSNFVSSNFTVISACSNLSTKLRRTVSGSRNDITWDALFFYCYYSEENICHFCVFIV